MCIAPVRAPNNGVLVACRGCWQCVSSKEYDWVGRCIAEAKYSDHVRFVTLTYAGDTPASVVFTKRHIQQMMYRLRTDGRRKGADGWSVRYIITGELGHHKGRVHWHGILFFKGNCPDMELTQFGKGHMFQWRYWPHGATVAKTADHKAFRYVVKYMFKDVNRDAGYLNPPASMSKKPPIGDQFVSDFAADLVAKRLPLSSPEYSFMGVKEKKSGAHRKFWLQGRSRENLMQRYADLWRETHGSEPPPSDYLMERHFDKIARAEMAADTSRVERDIEAKRPKISARKLRDEIFAADGQDPFGAERRQVAILMIRRGDDVGTVELFTDETALIQIGDEPESLLSRSTGSYSELVAQLEAAGLRPRDVRKVSRWLAAKWRITVPGDRAAA